MTHAVNLRTFKPMCGSRPKGGCVTTDVRAWVTCKRCLRMLDAGRSVR